jgi:hypothetical protein
MSPPVIEATVDSLHTLNNVAMELAECHVVDPGGACWKETRMVTLAPTQQENSG